MLITFQLLFQAILAEDRKKPHQDPLSVADQKRKKHSLKIATRGERATHAGNFLLRTGGLRVRRLIRWKQHFFTNQARSAGGREKRKADVEDYKAFL